MNEQKSHSLESILNLPASTDWHENGVYAVVNGEGKLFQETASETAYSARATLFRELNTPWSRAEDNDYMMVRYAAAANLTRSDDWHADGLYAMVDKNGQMLFDTVADTGYACRALYTHVHHLIWSNASEKGMQIVPLVPAGRVESLRKGMSA